MIASSRTSPAHLGSSSSPALMPDMTCRPIRDDGYPDVATYNKELEQLGNPSWLNIPWLYCECYLYRYETKPVLATR